MIKALKIYSPSIVLIIWAAVWAIGIQGTLVVVVGLMATALAVCCHVRTVVYTRPWKNVRRV
jgi:hypothetical protein